MWGMVLYIEKWKVRFGGTGCIPGSWPPLGGKDLKSKSSICFASITPFYI